MILLCVETHHVSHIFNRISAKGRCAKHIMNFNAFSFSFNYFRSFNSFKLMANMWHNTINYKNWSEWENKRFYNHQMQHTNSFHTTFRQSAKFKNFTAFDYFVFDTKLRRIVTLTSTKAILRAKYFAAYLSMCHLSWCCQILRLFLNSGIPC